MLSRRELDHFVLDVELVLISVVQGVALTTLAVEAAPVLRSRDPSAWMFLATGLLFILSFWSAALIHAISFVAWPMDLLHYFFYFALALLECLTFTRMEQPGAWFGFSAACFAIILALYVYDYRLIRNRRLMFEGSDALRRLYRHVLDRQRLEMLALVPAGLAFNLVAMRVTGRRPGAAALMALLQLLLTLMFVANFVRSFSERLRLIPARED